jgi:putative SOS response-associated peptidase YedK
MVDPYTHSNTGKRTVIPLEAHDFDRWLTCTVDEAREMLKVPPVELFDAAPVEA